MTYARQPPLLYCAPLLMGWSAWPVYAQPAALRNAEGVLSAPLGRGTALTVINTAEDGACWVVLEASHNRWLGCGLGAMPEVRQITVSPDHAWLAVLVTGEGHPAVEIVDLARLTGHKDYVVRQTLNPYPGSIWLAGWRGRTLRVESDASLGQPQAVTGPRRLFAVEVESGKITRLPGYTAKRR